jgi:hypothetical protein
MTTHDLAQQLRERQRAAGMVESGLIDALSDDDIIDCYVTCSDCGKRQVAGKRLETAIANAADADGFFRLCGRLATHRPHR